jgi:hypothetical protein
MLKSRAVDRKPCRTSKLSGSEWVAELLDIDYNVRRVRETFRMQVSTFQQICSMLEAKQVLKGGRRISSLEKLAIFLYITRHSCSNRQAQERFQRSGETISKYNIFNGNFTLIYYPHSDVFMKFLELLFG